MSEVEVFSPGEALPPRPEAIPSRRAVATAEMWLRPFPPGSYTRAAYERDVLGGTVKRGHRWSLDAFPAAAPAPFFEWCRAVNVDPLDIEPGHIILWKSWLDEFELSASTVARKLTAVRGFYDCAVETARVMDRSPVPRSNKPLHLAPVPNESTTRGLSEREVGAIINAARARSLRDVAIVVLLYYQGLRVSEVINLDVDSLGWEDPHRTLTVWGKGRKRRKQVLSPYAAVEIDAYLADRTAQGEIDEQNLPAPVTARRGHDRVPLFPGSADGRMTRRQIDHLVAESAIHGGVRGANPDDEQNPGHLITPHVLRHAITTHLRSDGADLGDVQDHLGHAQPQTTMRYDRARSRLDRSPVYRAKRVDLDTT